MLSSEERVIELSKVKTILGLLATGVFFVFGALCITSDPQHFATAGRYISPVYVYGIGVVTIILSGLAFFVGAKKLFDKSPGLVLNSDGILDNSRGLLIPWPEIVDIGQCEVGELKFVLIHVLDPEKYTKNGNAIRRMLDRAEKKKHGTPIQISAGILKIDYEELFETIKEFHSNNHSNA